MKALPVADTRRDGAVLLPNEFARIAAIAEREAGLAIPDAKRSMVQTRLNRRLRATGLPAFSNYLSLVESPAGLDERRHMIAALTTNVSSFFREAHHFRTLAEDVLPPLIDRARTGDRIRLWSAGCSTGQEPYSIAMTLLDALPNAARYDIRVLATDIDRSVLFRAASGAFDAGQVQTIPGAAREAYFSNSEEGGRAGPALRELIAFRQLNLIDDWPMRGAFDAIFCRNVLIYFSDRTQRALWPRFASVLAPGGWLFLGHSERIHGETGRPFRSAGVTTYRKL